MLPDAAVVVLDAAALPLARRTVTALEGATLHGRLAAPDIDERFDDVGAHLRELFAAGIPIVALCATGIIVRALAPLLADKRVEPPVVAVAADASSVVPLLGGHRGANRLAARLAATLGSHAAITTASDLGPGVALDDPPPGWTLAAASDLRPALAKLRDGRRIVVDDGGFDIAWLGTVRTTGAEADVTVTTRRKRSSNAALVPRVLAVGVGCERGLPAADLRTLVDVTLAEHDLATEAVALIASIDLKAGEPAVRAIAEHLRVPLRVFDATTLEWETPRLATPSEVVFREVGCHGVAEAAALAAVGGDGDLVVPKVKGARATVAVAQATAPLDPESVGRAAGSLALLSLGPGERMGRTRAVDAALRRCTDLVGYGPYLDLVEPAVRGRRHAFPLGAEAERCRAALALAVAGADVGLVGSGDVGVYAMAALVHELAAGDPAFQTVPIEVLPGVSAMHVAAARTGALLGHDFCAVSLSDLLTPWPVIAARLDAAARGDFVTALYNPVSRARREGFGKALTILRAHRPADTPCVVGRNVGRSDETTTILRLDELATANVDMLTIVLVGSSLSRIWTDAYGRRFAFTPRGYGSA